MLRMSIALKHEAWIPPFQVLGSWICPPFISILGLLGTVILGIACRLVEQYFLLVGRAIV